MGKLSPDQIAVLAERLSVAGETPGERAQLVAVLGTFAYPENPAKPPCVGRTSDFLPSKNAAPLVFITTNWAAGLAARRREYYERCTRQSRAELAALFDDIAAAQACADPASWLEFSSSQKGRIHWVPVPIISPSSSARSH